MFNEEDELKLVEFVKDNELLYNNPERGFGLLAQGAKLSETQVVHRRGHPSQN